MDLHNSFDASQYIGDSPVGFDFGAPSPAVHNPTSQAFGVGITAGTHGSQLAGQTLQSALPLPRSAVPVGVAKGHTAQGAQPLGIHVHGLPSPASYTESPRAQSHTSSQSATPLTTHPSQMPHFVGNAADFAPVSASNALPPSFGAPALASGVPQPSLQSPSPASQVPVPMPMGPPALPTGALVMSQEQQMQQQLAQMQMMMAMMTAGGNRFSTGSSTSNEPATATSEDEQQLVQALHEAERLERTYRQVIDDWASKRNEPLEKWQNWYLENGERLEKLIDTWTAPSAAIVVPVPVRKVKKPVFDRPASPELVPSGKKKKAQSKRPSATSDEDVKPSAAELRAASSTSVRRNTGRSSETGLARTAASAASNTNPLKRKASTGNISGAPVRRPAPHNTRIGFAETTKKLPLLQADVIIPPVRSHSPTPPKEIVPNPSGRPGHIYTRADRDFFVDFIQFELGRDPELTKQELCDMLYAKAPHHSADSWKSHWSSRHALADNILRLAAERVAARDRAANRAAADAAADESGSFRKAAPRAAPIKPHTSTSTKARIETPTDSEYDGDVATDWSDNEEEIGQMGSRDAVLTEVDMRAMAKYIARYDMNEWKGMKNRTRWLPFAETHSQRSADAWASHYVRRKKVIIDLVLRFRKRIKKRTRKGLDLGLSRKTKVTPKVGKASAQPRPTPERRPATASSSTAGAMSVATAPPSASEASAPAEDTSASLPFKSRWKMMQGRMPPLSAANFDSPDASARTTPSVTTPPASASTVGKFATNGKGKAPMSSPPSPLSEDMDQDAEGEPDDDLS